MQLSDQTKELLYTVWAFIIISGFAGGPVILLISLGPWISLISTPLFSIVWYFVNYGRGSGYVLFRLPLFIIVLCCQLATCSEAILGIVSQHI